MVKAHLLGPGFQLLFEQCPGLFLVLAPDPCFTILAVTDAYLRATGSTRAALLGQGVFEAFPDNPSDRQANGVENLRASLERVIAARKPDRMAVQKYDIRRLADHPEGEFEERYWSPLNTPVFSSTGELQYILHQVEDVTDIILPALRREEERSESEDRSRRTEAELQRRTREVEAALQRLAALNQELRESEQRFRAVLASLSEGITFQDAQGVLHMANQSAERLLGLSFDQFVGRTSLDPRWCALGADGQPLPGEHHPAMVALRTRQPVSGFVMGLHRPEGTYVWLSVNCQPLFEQDGRTLIGVVSSFFDITEQKRADEERERLLKELGEAVRLRDEFLSIASHELNTPLTSLSLKLQTITRAAGSNSGVGPVSVLWRDIELMRRQVQRISALVNDLLDVARISTGRMKLTLESVDLSALVLEVVSRFEPEATRAGCTLEVRAAPSVVGQWDRVRLEQVISNLLSNALKYGAGRPVRIWLEPVGERVRLGVQDQGIGIHPEALQRIFEKFERDVSERHYGGLGLGLYVTRQIVETLRGEIRVESEPARGATFTVELPWTLA